jgi:AcrR family transcriptional regulator
VDWIMSSKPARLINRADKTRRALLRAGIELLADRSLEAIPIDDVVAAAGVAKGSFFNHFADKQEFGRAVASEVRAEFEDVIARMNAAISDPVERMARAMQLCVEFALSERKRSLVMTRGAYRLSTRKEPLNSGVIADLENCIVSGQYRPEATKGGLLFLLGLCQSIMRNAIEQRWSRTVAAERLRELQVMGLIGLGVSPARAAKLASEGKKAVLTSAHRRYIREARRPDQ